MKVFSVFGVSGSGKTTTIEHLLREMRRRQYRVGTVKNIHCKEFTLDREGTNTWRHIQAGSDMVAAWGLAETGLIVRRRLGLDELLTFFTQEYVILEGVQDFPVPKILCAHSVMEIEERLDQRVFAISGCIANSLTEFRGVPVVNAVTDTATLMDLIEAKVTEYKSVATIR